MLPIFFNSCDLFTTRAPEIPDSDKSSYRPPTDAQVVVKNFLNSINEKNAENYRSCFADTSLGDLLPFEFIASAEANARYIGIFEKWSLIDEHRAYLSMISNLSDDIYPSLQLASSDFDVILSDSALYTTNYILTINHNKGTLGKKFAGTIQLTMFPRTNGLWSIRRWTDTKSNDSIPTTWSEMKANFIN